MSRVTRSQSKKEIKEEVDQKKVIHKELKVIPTLKVTKLHVGKEKVYSMVFKNKEGFTKAQTLELVENAQKNLQHRFISEHSERLLLPQA